MRPLFAALLLAVHPVLGYSLPTHATLSDHALNILKPDPRYGEIVGFGSTIVTHCEKEDDTPRFDCHFYDPDDPLGGLPRNSYTALYDLLGGGTMPGQYASPTRYVSALDWATSNMPDDLDWEGAINAYDYTAASRRKAYTAVAHVLHRIQDMAQPDHARNRPHPGNYAADKIATVSPWAAAQFAAGKLGYEAFAVHVTWTPGVVPRRLESLKEGFDALARLSQAEEAQRNIPYADENACGLAPVAFLANEPYHRLYVSHVSRKYQDNLWAKFEMHAALQPTIPYPRTDARSQNYTELAQAILPAAEEYGAGLLVLFKEIVQPPPYVREVVITQKGAEKYRATWVDQTADDRVTGRTLSRQGGGALETGVEAEATVRFGPRPPDGVTPDADWWKYVSPRQFVIEYDGGETADLSGWKSIDAGADPRWVVTFTPIKAGRLVLDAQDLYPHYGGRDPEGQGLRGDLLDTDPATPAKAAGVRPFELTGYEPGADRNHHFTVGGGCQGALSREEMLRITRYGTWKGTVRFKQHHVHTWKDSSTNTRDWEMTIRGQELRSLRMENDYDRSHFGGRRGTLHTRGFNKMHFFKHPEDDWNKPGVLDGETFANGTLTIQNGGADRPDGWYYVNLKLDPAIDQNDANNQLIIGRDVGNNHPGFAYLEGNLCEAGKLSGTRSGTKHWETDATIEDLEWSVTWEFEFTGNAPPDHVELCRPVWEFGRLVTALGGYQTEAVKLAGAAAQSLARQPSAAPAYTAAMTELSQAARTDPLNAVIQEMSTPCLEADTYWLDHEPDFAAKYQERLVQLRAGHERWDAALRAFTTRLAAATDAMAKAVQPVDAGTAKQLRAQAKKLRDQGLSAFAPAPPG
ncbi:MAG: hypothetical protein HYU66_29210 [Armatimonadetes bacterium]|nr:hypothetical protein [Armatimonadota bacterium]